MAARASKVPHAFPSDPIGAEFCAWFWCANQGWDWIRGNVPTSENKTNWITEPYPIQPDELWYLFLEPSEAVGVGFKRHTKYSVIDLDESSNYHPYNSQEGYEGLLNALQVIGLMSPVVVRSSWSEGIHLYYPLPKRVPSFGIACAVKWALFDAQIFLQGGQVESFPNCKSFAKEGFVEYKAHRLPLQPGSGSTLLDSCLEPYSESVEDLLDEFRRASKQQDLELLENAIAQSWERQRLSRGWGSGDRAERWKRILEERLLNGWTAFSQTNALLKDIATYGRVFLSLDGPTLVQYTVEQATSAPGYEKYCRHQHEIRRRATDWCRSVERFYWPLGTERIREGTYKENFNDCPKPSPANNIVPFAANDKRSEAAEERIKLAVATLEEAGELPPTSTARASAIIKAAKELSGTGISQTTLHKPKFMPLWHPKHRTESCVIACPEHVSEICSQPESVQISFENTASELVESLHGEDLSDNYTPKSYMKGLGGIENSPKGTPITPDLGAQHIAPIDSNNQNQSINHIDLASDTESSKALTYKSFKSIEFPSDRKKADNQSLSLVVGPVPPVAPGPVVEVAPPVPNTPASQALSPMARIVAMRIAIGKQLQEWLRLQPRPTSEKGFRQRNAEMERLKMQLYLESGEPLLIREAERFFGQTKIPVGETAVSSSPVIKAESVAVAVAKSNEPVEAVRVAKPESLTRSTVPVPPSPRLPAPCPTVTPAVTEPETLAVTSVPLSPSPPLPCPPAPCIAPAAKPSTQPDAPWWAARIKPREEEGSRFAVGQKVIYEGQEYTILATTHIHSQLEGLAGAVSNFWLEEV